jgi:hypothetical protein
VDHLNHLNWLWIGVMATVPPLIGLAVASIFWRFMKDPGVGNVVGSLVIIGGIFLLISREFSELAILTGACLQSGHVCWPTPSGFIRYMIYACIGLFEIAALFSLSLTVEERRRRRGYSREWGGSR